MCSDLDHIHGAFSVVVPIDDMCILMQIRFLVLLEGQSIVQDDGKAHIGICHHIGFDADTSLLENLVAVTLLRRYGTDDAVFFYNRNVEVDFYLPDTGVAIQVCYTMNLSDETFQREVQALVKLNKVFECRQLLIITYDDEERIELEKCAIEVIPVWKWLLGK